MVYSHTEKFKVAEYARQNGVRVAARHFSVHHKNVQRWLISEIEKVPMKSGRMKPRMNMKGQGRKISYPPSLEGELVAWVLSKQSYIPVSNRMIKLKALSLIRPVLPAFKASDGWCRKFLARNNLVSRAATSTAQALPADLEDNLAVQTSCQ